MISIKDNFPTGIEFGDNKCSCGQNKFIILDNARYDSTAAMYANKQLIEIYNMINTVMLE